MITDLRRLWQQAFGDTEEFLDAFFAVGYAPERCKTLTVDGKVVAMLYWFDCRLEEKRIAYLYAVATDAAYRGQGLCRKLMESTHQHLRSLGYAGAILVPGSAELFSMYEKMGYRTCSYIRDFTCPAGTPVALRCIDPEVYADLRRQLLPAGGVVQEGAAIRLLAKQAQFYAGADFILSATKQADRLTVHELLGNAAAAPGITAALGAQTGRFRTPGGESPFAMFYALSDCQTPSYFGIALD